MKFALKIKTAEDLRAEIDAAQRAERRAEALRYLAETDWLVTRQMETGKAIPADVAAKRAEARKTAQG